MCVTFILLCTGDTVVTRGAGCFFGQREAFACFITSTVGSTGAWVGRLLGDLSGNTSFGVGVGVFGGTGFHASTVQCVVTTGIIWCMACDSLIAYIDSTREAIIRDECVVLGVLASFDWITYVTCAGIFVVTNCCCSALTDTSLTRLLLCTEGRRTGCVVREFCEDTLSGL